MKNQLLSYVSSALLLFGGLFLILAKSYWAGGLIVLSSIISVIISIKLKKNNN